MHRSRIGGWTVQRPLKEGGRYFVESGRTYSCGACRHSGTFIRLEPVYVPRPLYEERSSDYDRDDGWYDR